MTTAPHAPPALTLALIPTTTSKGFGTPGPGPWRLKAASSIYDSGVLCTIFAEDGPPPALKTTTQAGHPPLQWWAAQSSPTVNSYVYT